MSGKSPKKIIIVPGKIVNIVFKSFFKYLVRYHFWVSISFSFLCLLVMIGLNFFSFKILSLSFFSCFLAYNFINNIKENVNQGLIVMNKFSINKLLFLLLFFILIYLFLNLNLSSVISFILFAPFIIFYSYFRRIKYFKIFMIALVWSYFSVFLPAVELLVPIDEKIILIFSAIYLKVFAITIPFDIRDIEFDKSKLVTIPLKIGIQNQKYYLLYYHQFQLS